MRRYLIRFLIIGVMLTIMIDINKNPGTNYTTQIQSTVTNQTIDLREVYNWASLKKDQLGNISFMYISDFLTLFGYETEKGY